MTPPQALGLQQLVDPAAFDRDALLLVEVGSKTVERPAAERQPQALGIGQRRCDDLGALRDGKGKGPPGPGPILQALEPSVIEAMDPGVDRRPREAQVAGHLAGSSSVGDGQEDPSPLDESGLGRA
jgi:hypothetical protein